MKLRYYFILLAGFSAAFFLYPYWPKKPVVWQGLTSKNETLISVLSKASQPLSHSLEHPSLGSHPLRVSKKIQSFKDKIEHFALRGLKPGEDYFFVIKNKRGKVVDKRVFQTRGLNQAALTFGAASCMNDKWRGQGPIWSELLSFKPDMVFLIGDNIYADQYIYSVSMENLSRRYKETLRTLNLYKSKRLVPILAIWDDHDYGLNNGDKHFKYKKEMQKLFRGFFFLPEEGPHLERGPGVSFLLKTKYQKFFFMDDQSFRDSFKEGSLWGKAQEHWLTEGLSLSPKPSWIISGSQIFGRHHVFESYEKDFPNSFKKMMKKIGESKSPALFLTGDRHLSELQKIKMGPLSTFEITTSPIHAGVYSAKPPENSKRHLHFVSGKLNYALIKSHAGEGGLEVFVQVYGKGKNLLYSETLNLPE